MEKDDIKNESETFTQDQNMNLGVLDNEREDL